MVNSWTWLTHKNFEEIIRSSIPYWLKFGNYICDSRTFAMRSSQSHRPGMPQPWTAAFRNTVISHMVKMGVAPLKLTPITCLFTSATSQPITSNSDMHERRSQWIRQPVLALVWDPPTIALCWFHNCNYANDYTQDSSSSDRHWFYPTDWTAACCK